MKPRAFIGSSQEHLDLARAVQANLEVDVETRVWDQDVFRLSEYPLEALRTQLGASDFGIFILSPSDLATIRSKQLAVPRDNVVFELGLFAGHLGHKRTFVITPRGAKTLHLPTDLQGLTVGQYDAHRSDGNLTAALAPVCHKIRQLITERAPLVMKYRTGLRWSGMFSDFDKRFTELINGATKITLFFIHSRRWRENNHDPMQRFLAKPETELVVFLPDLRNGQLIRTIMGHFDDGPHIPGLIADAYRYFRDLKKRAASKVTIRLFNIYPTYSFYKFDQTCLVAMYPTTAIRKSVPAFEIVSDSTFAEFVEEDIRQLVRECREPKVPELTRLQQVGLGMSRAEGAERHSRRRSSRATR